MVKLITRLLYVNMENKQKAKSEGAGSPKESRNRGGTSVRHTHMWEESTRQISAYVLCKPKFSKIFMIFLFLQLCGCNPRLSPCGTWKCAIWQPAS
jgi:hypothetical protein